MSLFAIALIAGVAHAEPIAWAWKPSQVVNYHAEITRERDDGDWHQAITNVEARAHQTNLAVDLSCAVTEEVKKGWLMECTFHNVSISGIAMGDEQDKLNTIFAEYEANLEQASAVFEMSSVGRIKGFDLRTFVEPSNERKGQVIDAMRMLMVRPFALLELELPKSGDDKGKDWKQGGSPILTQLRSSYGTAGAVIIKHSVESSDADMISIGTEGRGTVAYGLAVESDGTKTIGLDLAGSSVFDQGQGVLARRESMVVGRFTAGAAYSSPTDHFREVLILERIDAIPEPTAAPAPEPESAPEPAPEAPASE